MEPAYAQHPARRRRPTRYRHALQALSLLALQAGAPQPEPLSEQELERLALDHEPAPLPWEADFDAATHALDERTRTEALQ